MKTERLLCKYLAYKNTYSDKTNSLVYPEETVLAQIKSEQEIKIFKQKDPAKLYVRSTKKHKCGNYDTKKLLFLRLFIIFLNLILAIYL